MRHLLAILLFAGTSLPALAATFTVTTNADSGPGSLRQAILDSNGNGAATADVIEFDIPGSGPHTITVASNLPLINSPIVIDGTTQPGWVANTNTPEQGGLNGTLAIHLTTSQPPAGTVGLLVDASGSGAAGPRVVRGLAISAFNVAISYSGPTNLTLEGNYFGTDASGVTVPRAISQGLSLTSITGPVVVGGSTPAARNLYASSNPASGIAINVPSVGTAGTLLIQGNLVGTDRTGTLARPWNVGIQVIAYSTGISPVPASGVLIGGPTPAARNLLSGNGNYGLIVATAIGGDPQGIAVEGNFIGTDITGTLPLPNGRLAADHAGVIWVQNRLSSAGPVSRIGGTLPGSGNRIAFNIGGGIRTRATPAVTTFGSFAIQGNEIYANQGAPIEIEQTARANDPGDPDTGINRGQNWPVFTAGARQSATVFDATVQVDTTVANATYPISVEFFRATTGQVEAIESIGTLSISAAQAQQPVSTTLTLPVPKPLGFITAIATDAAGNSSEVSDPLNLNLVFQDGFE